MNHFIARLGACVWVYLISDIEFFISLRSRFKAIAFSSEDDWEEDDDAMWCNLCDDDALATRDVVVLDLVDDELLLNTCADLQSPKKDQSLVRRFTWAESKKDFKIVLFLTVFD